MNQIEFLLRLSENAQVKGDEIAERHNAERATHTKELLELSRMIELAKANVDEELYRFGALQKQPAKQPQLPQTQPQMPKANGPDKANNPHEQARG